MEINVTVQDLDAIFECVCVCVCVCYPFTGDALLLSGNHFASHFCHFCNIFNTDNRE